MSNIFEDDPEIAIRLFRERRKRDAATEADKLATALDSLLQALTTSDAAFEQDTAEQVLDEYRKAMKR